ncbi:LysM peptidoglycan-binding domain-containing M23 family metallopeptidase [Streptomyces sp. J2-1]|uniref:M23 family metallopeptidase n=1 Tax=Streptomyces corallincola TaxID=2851888 RepID=UPI001C38C000|nr:LysM peptidoglycan-binding domain-containing M23 family metallopeptidase [Streptomyces corallincola]MBV2355299.1 LysM peptidoglycan-binding domain-containing M23 family metallopeptidase [Streptomyces corallincola]
MPASGKHRRPKPHRLGRSIAVAGTGGAALALPLIGATGAHAAPGHPAAARPATAPAPSAPSAAPSAPTVSAERQTPDHRPQGTRTYTVRSGDWLAKIAEEHAVDGGWQRIYDDNRQAVGGDPSLIHPGLKLALDGRSAPAPARPATPPRPSRPSRPAPERPSAAPKSAPTAPSTATGYALPVVGATIGTGYHVPGGMWSSGYHTGIDFVVPTGTTVRSVAAGTVVSAGWGGAYGNQVVVRLHDGRYAQYAHLSQLSVVVGESVTEGERLGLSGATGNVTGPHLHFEIRTAAGYGSDMDPVTYLRAHGVGL